MAIVILYQRRINKYNGFVQRFMDETCCLQYIPVRYRVLIGMVMFQTSNCIAHFVVVVVRLVRTIIYPQLVQGVLSLQEGFAIAVTAHVFLLVNVSARSLIRKSQDIYI